MAYGAEQRGAYHHVTVIVVQSDRLRRYSLYNRARLSTNFRYLIL